MSHIRSLLTFTQLLDVIEGDEDIGFCIACGAEHYGIEPDARKYTCEACDLPKVYGAEELVLMLYPSAQVV